MLRIAGQTAGPIGLNFFVNTNGLPGGVRNSKFKKMKIFFTKTQIFKSIYF